MTVCVAAGCKEGDDFRIILCRLASSGIGTSDSMLKIRSLPYGYRCLMAGESADILATVSLLRTHMGSVKRIDESNLPALVRSALTDRKKEKVDEFVRGRYGFSYDELLKVGKEKLPPEELRDAYARIGQIGIDTGMIVAGFDGHGLPLIVETDEDCKVSLREDFAVVGSVPSGSEWNFI